MYDLCDVLHASFGSADVVSHVLREYGEGSMGNGIRRLAGEMLTVGGQQSYGLGYNKGVSETYPTAYKDGLITGSIATIGTAVLIGVGVWGTKKFIDHYRDKKQEPARLTPKKAEVSVNA